MIINLAQKAYGDDVLWNAVFGSKTTDYLAKIVLENALPIDTAYKILLNEVRIEYPFVRMATVVNLFNDFLETTQEMIESGEYLFA